MARVDPPWPDEVRILTREELADLIERARAGCLRGPQLDDEAGLPPPPIDLLDLRGWSPAKVVDPETVLAAAQFRRWAATQPKRGRARYPGGARRGAPR